MKVCAIVPSYNRRHMLAECLESLLRQTRPVDQILVVDDGSTDGTDEVLAGFADRITFVRQENAGKAVALNRALGMVSADLVWICDDDDIALEDALETLITPLLADAELDLVFARHMRFVDVAGERRLLPPSFDKRPNETNLHLAFWEDMFCFQFSTLSRLGVYRRTGGFDASLKRSQDYDMALRMTRAHRATYVDKVVFLQREHGGARGPGGAIRSQAEMLRAWLHHDQAIFRRLLPGLSIADFTPSFAMAYPPEAARAAALLERGLVLAKRGVWDEAIKSLQASGHLATPFTADEANLCRVMFRSAMSFEALAADRDALRALRNMRRTGRGRAMVFALLRACRWMIADALRQRNWREAAMLADILLTVLGPFQAAARMYRAAA